MLKIVTLFVCYSSLAIASSEFDRKPTRKIAHTLKQWLQETYDIEALKSFLTAHEDKFEGNGINIARLLSRMIDFNSKVAASDFAVKNLEALTSIHSRLSAVENIQAVNTLRAKARNYDACVGLCKSFNSRRLHLKLDITDDFDDAYHSYWFASAEADVLKSLNRLEALTFAAENRPSLVEAVRTAKRKLTASGIPETSPTWISLNALIKSAVIAYWKSPTKDEAKGSMHFILADILLKCENSGATHFESKREDALQRAASVAALEEERIARAAAKAEWAFKREKVAREREEAELARIEAMWVPAQSQESLEEEMQMIIDEISPLALELQSGLAELQSDAALTKPAKNIVSMISPLLRRFNENTALADKAAAAYEINCYLTVRYIAKETGCMLTKLLGEILGDSKKLTNYAEWKDLSERITVRAATISAEKIKHISIIDACNLDTALERLAIVETSCQGLTRPDRMECISKLRGLMPSSRVTPGSLLKDIRRESCAVLQALSGCSYHSLPDRRWEACSSIMKMVTAWESKDDIRGLIELLREIQQAEFNDEQAGQSEAILKGILRMSRDMGEGSMGHPDYNGKLAALIGSLDTDKSMENLKRVQREVSRLYSTHPK